MDERRARLSNDSRADGAVTTLDRVHAAMLLQANGQANGLRALIKTEQERGPDFLRLANALSALYPEKQRRETAARRDALRCPGSMQESANNLADFRGDLLRATTKIFFFSMA